MPDATAPYRADEVGSLLRTAPLKEARAKREKGEINQSQLKAVEDEEIRAQIRRSPRRLDALLSDDDDDAGDRTGEGDRLVSAAAGVHERPLAGGDDDHAASRPAVSAREDRGPPALEAEAAGQKLHDGRLARSAEGQVADGFFDWVHPQSRSFIVKYTHQFGTS